MTLVAYPVDGRSARSNRTLQYLKEYSTEPYTSSSILCQLRHDVLHVWYLRAMLLILSLQRYLHWSLALA